MYWWNRCTLSFECVNFIDNCTSLSAKLHNPELCLCIAKRFFTHIRNILIQPVHLFSFEIDIFGQRVEFFHVLDVQFFISLRQLFVPEIVLDSARPY